MSYAGDVTPAEAWAALSDDPAAVLVDVRTAAEWTYVGVPDLRPIGKDVVPIEWQRYPGGVRNDGFLAELTAHVGDRSAPVYFLCRSGVRSVAAADAATEAGWTAAHNVLEGFEGPHDGEQHRTVAGWKVAGLPWVQG
ncbi:MAG: Rhodanese domain protein [Humibacillus sp.]|nr:Rhodanese domain protein [Humibacillus sp.]